MTKYAVSDKFKGEQMLIKTHEESLRLGLLKMTGAYSKNFTDIIKRHEQVQKHLVSSHISIRGASLGTLLLSNFGEQCLSLQNTNLLPFFSTFKTYKVLSYCKIFLFSYWQELLVFCSRGPRCWVHI